MQSLSTSSINSPLGELFLLASSKGLAALDWVPLKSDPRNNDREAEHHLALAKGQLREYFAGERKRFQLPLDLTGSAFQKHVWSCLQQIPYGETRSYLDIAMAIGNKNACRAVGGANGKNPLPIIVPCHRVIAADGRLGGYSGGLSIKKFLLELEGHALP